MEILFQSHHAKVSDRLRERGDPSADIDAHRIDSMPEPAGRIEPQIGGGIT